MLDVVLRLVELQADAGIPAGERDFTGYVANVLFGGWDDVWADAPRACAAAGPLCARLRRWLQHVPARSIGKLRDNVAAGVCHLPGLNDFAGHGALMAQGVGELSHELIVISPPLAGHFYHLPALPSPWAACR